MAYAIGVADPVSVMVDTFGTGKVSDDRLTDARAQAFRPLTPQGIIEQLKLRRPIYQKTAAYGHFGRSDFAWENTAMAKVLARARLEDRDPSRMRILVLGGTRFLGRCFVESALRRP